MTTIKSRDVDSSDDASSASSASNASAEGPARSSKRPFGRWRGRGADGRRRWGRAELITIGIPALIAYVPLLLTHPGMVGADTKTYLYLDPGKLLAGAPFVWDYQIGFGTVTHQNIGYLWPMGPFYLFFDALRVPDWVAQRLWLGSVMLAAGLGVRYLLGMFNETRAKAVATGATRPPFGPAAILVASLSYMLSPYLLDYSARISVILMPWAALPWLIALAAKSIRHGGWRYPALFAFVVVTVGGINATALILVGLGPLLWVAHAVFVDREATLRQALAALGRIGLLSLLANLWWILGLWAEGKHGLPVIRYTESYRTVASVSSAPEVLRGLGYWFFYGNDKLGPWIEPSQQYTTQLWLIALSYGLPILGLVSAALIRWRYRAYFAGLMLVGTLVAVGSHPWDDPSFLGGLFKTFTRTDAGLSLRSTPRAVPLVILGTAVFLAAGVEALGRRLPRLAVPAAVLACLLIAANIPPLWTNTMVAKNLERSEQLPDYWNEDAAYLESRGQATRVLEIPGADFASYRWGNTVDPVLPGLMTRQYLARELFQWGSPPSANLINSLDRRLHEDLMDPEAIAPMARLMGVGDINVRSDMQYERYRVARPRQLWDLLSRTPGLGEPVGFGGTTPPNRAGPENTLIDEVELGTDPALPEPPKVAAFPVEDALPIIRTQSADQPLLVAGDGDGLVDAASIDLLNPEQAIFYIASSQDPTTFDQVYGNGADLLLTDTNRKRARRWGALRENAGYTERADEVAPFDHTDQRLDLFPGASDDSYTVTQQAAATSGSNPAIVTASNYGNPITYTPDDRATNAMDGDPLTAWRVGALSTVKDEKLIVNLKDPLPIDSINLMQPINLERTRWITKARLIFDGPDGTTSEEIALGDESRDEDTRTGQTFTFAPRTATRITIQILDTNLGDVAGWDGISGVGLSEVRIPGVDNRELVQLPRDLLQRAGASSIDHRLSVLFTRLRSNPREPVRNDEEPGLNRLFTLPTARSFAIDGQARLSGLLDGDHADNQIDQVLGLPTAEQGGVTALADVHLPGDLRQRASASIDGDPTTFWTSIYQRQTDHYLEYTVPAPGLTFDHLDLQIVNDGRHSLPTQFLVSVDGIDQFTVDLPPIDAQDAVNGTITVPVTLPRAVSGTTFRFTITGAAERKTDEWYSGGTTTLPISIAEIGVPGLHLAPAGPTFDSGCRTNLIQVDGKPVPVRISGSTADAIDRQALPVVACSPVGSVPGALDGTDIPLDAGDHIVTTTPGREEGVQIDIDRLALTSDRGGAALAPDELPTAVAPGPEASGASFDRVDGHLTVARADRPFWLTLGQSWSAGWEATVNGTNLGPSTTINGFGNGWYVDPAVVGTGPLEITMSWTPQKVVWIAIGISAVTALLLLFLMFHRQSRRRETPLLDDESDRSNTPVLALPWDGWGASRTIVTADGTTTDAPAAVSRRSRAASRPVAAVVAVVAALFTAVNLPIYYFAPLLAVPAGLVVYAGLRRRIGRSWLGLAGAGALGLAVSFMLLQQWRHEYGSNFIWPIWFGRVHVLGLAAVFLLGAEVLRDLFPLHVRSGDGPPTGERQDDDR